MPASASAGARAISRSALIGEQADLTYPLRLSRRRAGDAGGVAAGRHGSPKCCKQAERPLMLIGAGALARPMARRLPRWPPRPRSNCGAIKDGWNGFTVLHTAASRVGALDLGLVPGEGGLDAAEMAQPAALEVVFLLGADEIEVAPGRIRRLHRHPRRSRRAARRRDPAGRRLSGKVRRSTSTPKAACRWPTAQRSRRAMRARTGRYCARCPRCWAAGCPTIRWPRCGGRCLRRIRICMRLDQIAPGDAGDIEGWRILAGRRTRGRSARRSTTSISPIRSPGPPPSWRNARRLARRTPAMTAAE